MDFEFLSPAGDNKIGVLRRLEETVTQWELLVGYSRQKSKYIHTCGYFFLIPPRGISLDGAAIPLPFPTGKLYGGGTSNVSLNRPRSTFLTSRVDGLPHDFLVGAFDMLDRSWAETAVLPSLILSFKNSAANNIRI